MTHQDPRLVLLNALRQYDYQGRVALTTYRPSDIDVLTGEGADLVFLPFRDAADQAARLILQSNRNGFL